MSLVFAKESVDTAWDEVFALAQQHWAGTRTYRRHEPFCPSKERYQACDQAGFFHLFTARDGARLAGYFGVYVTQSMHSQLPMAMEDTFFLHPDYRGGRTALRFVRFIEEQCAALGVQEILFSCEIDNESGIKKLLSVLDYSPVIIQYSKHLSSPTRADSAHDASVEVSDVRTVASSRT